jgi:hypothetical protein
LKRVFDTVTVKRDGMPDIPKLEVIEMTPSVQPAKPMDGRKAASTIALLAGIWFFISPWVYNAYRMPNAWNNWIVGAIIVILAATRMGASDMMHTQWMSWINCLLGIWAFVSPWVYQYTGMTDRFVNSLCIGVILFIAAICSAMVSPHSHTPMPTHS